MMTDRHHLLTLKYNLGTKVISRAKVRKLFLVKGQKENILGMSQRRIEDVMCVLTRRKEIDLSSVFTSDFLKYNCKIEFSFCCNTGSADEESNKIWEAQYFF